MKKCKGCGAILQDKRNEEMGYVLNLEQDYCQRCFRLIHYGDAKKLKTENITNKDVLKLYEEYKEDVFVLIVEVFDALILDLDNLLDFYKDKKIILVVNKIDLLPFNIKDDKIDTLLSKVLSRINNKNIINCLLTYNKDPYFNKLFYSILDEFNFKRVVFAGRVNAGKSSIINKLCEDVSLTTSTFPGTTISSNIIENGKYTFIDTPGLNDSESYVDHIDKDLIKKLIPLKTIKSRVFQCYDDQTYSVEGLISIDVEPRKNVSLIFYINNDLEVHRTKLENGDLFIEKHTKDFKLKLLPFIKNRYKVNKSSMFYIKGLGYIKINGNSYISINVNEDIKVYKCEVEL